MCKQCWDAEARSNPTDYFTKELDALTRRHDDRARVTEIPIVARIKSPNRYDSRYCEIVFTPNKWYVEDHGCTNHYLHATMNKDLEELRKMHYGLAPAQALSVKYQDYYASADTCEDNDEEECDECGYTATACICCGDCGCAECTCEEEDDDDY